MIGQAKAGIGKTAVFVLAVLHQIEPEDGKVSCIVIAHTRELAQQVRFLLNNDTSVRATACALAPVQLFGCRGPSWVPCAPVYGLTAPDRCIFVVQ